VPWPDRAFAAKTLATVFLAPTWSSDVTAARVSAVVNGILECQFADDGQRKFLTDQLLSIAHRFGNATATAVASVAASSVPSELLTQLVSTAKKETHSAFLLALHSSGSSLVPESSAPSPKASRTSGQSLSKLKDAAEMIPATPQDCVEWAAALNAALLDAGEDSDVKAYMASVLRTAAQALSIDSDEERKLLVMRAVAGLVLRGVGKFTAVISSQEVAQAASALAGAVLDSAGLSVDADAVLAQVPLLETGLVIAKALSTATCVQGSSESEQQLFAKLKELCTRALPAFRDARRTVQMYLESTASGLPRKRHRGQDADPVRKSIAVSNVCLVVTGQLVQFFADVEANKNLKITPSWINR
jgi:hypothetical protein